MTFVLHVCKTCGYREHIGSALCGDEHPCLHTCPNCGGGDRFSQLMSRVDHATPDGKPIHQRPWRPGMTAVVDGD